MTYQVINTILWCFVLAIVIIGFFTSNVSSTNNHSKIEKSLEMNVIDQCWRLNPEWRRHRQQLAHCSVGYVGKMTNNIGEDLIHYKVTDPSDDPINPKPGTLRYGASMIQGVNVHIADNACLMIYKATNIIIHNIRIHHCRPQTPGMVMGPNGKMVFLMSQGVSTDVTVSNNWFRQQNKVMLLGHDDGFVRDKNMKVTVVYNYFGPNCHQRMPRIRHGYAHVANNLYMGWVQYAIGGSMEPSLKSESNLFIAPTSGNKEVIHS
ncbi:Pectin lyase fold/virulence factor, partial [Sesbania bispinosa]